MSVGGGRSWSVSGRGSLFGGLEVVVACRGVGTGGR